MPAFQKLAQQIGMQVAQEMTLSTLH
jgi:hypothetical protein